MPRDFEKNAIALLLAALVPLMLAAAAARHLFPAFHPALLKAAAACLAWLASLGIAHAARINAHVRIPVVKSLVSPANRQRLQTVADMAFLVFSLASLVIGLVVLHRSLAQAGAPGSPLVYASLPAGSALTILRLLERLAGKETRP